MTPLKPTKSANSTGSITRPPGVSKNVTTTMTEPTISATPPILFSALPITTTPSSKLRHTAGTPTGQSYHTTVPRRHECGTDFRAVPSEEAARLNALQGAFLFPSRRWKEAWVRFDRTASAGAPYEAAQRLSHRQGRVTNGAHHRSLGAETAVRHPRVELEGLVLNRRHIGKALGCGASAWVMPTHLP